MNDQEHGAHNTEAEVSGVTYDRAGLSIVKVGTTDSPRWPDPVGFGDIRLHKACGAGRNNAASQPAQWNVPMMAYLRTGQLPAWITRLKAYDLRFRRRYKKLLMSHLFYVLATIP